MKEIYHKALAQILSPLRHGMTTPHVMKCPDGHFRRAVFELGPFIADYPEQVYLSGVVSGWCPKWVHSRLPRPSISLPCRCRAYPDKLDEAGSPRFRAHDEACMETFSPRVLWDVFGINADVVVSNIRAHLLFT